MRRLWLAAMLMLVGCGARHPESDRFARGDMAIVYDAERDDIHARVKEDSGWNGMGFVPLPVGLRVTVLDDDGKGPDRNVRVGVQVPDHHGAALVPRPNLRPAP